MERAEDFGLGVPAGSNLALRGQLSHQFASRVIQIQPDEIAGVEIEISTPGAAVGDQLSDVVEIAGLGRKAPVSLKAGKRREGVCAGRSRERGVGSVRLVAPGAQSRVRGQAGGCL